MAFLNRLFSSQIEPSDLKEIHIQLVGDHASKNTRLQYVSEILLELNTPKIITFGLHMNIIKVANIEYKIWRLREEIAVDLNTFFAKKNIILICPDREDDIKYYHERYAALKSTRLHKHIVFLTDNMEFFKRAVAMNPSPRISVIYYPLRTDNVEAFLKMLREHFVDVARVKGRVSAK